MLQRVRERYVSNITVIIEHTFTYCCSPLTYNNVNDIILVCTPWHFSNWLPVVHSIIHSTVATDGQCACGFIECPGKIVTASTARLNFWFRSWLRSWSWLRCFNCCKSDRNNMVTCYSKCIAVHGIAVNKNSINLIIFIRCGSNCHCFAGCGSSFIHCHSTVFILNYCNGKSFRNRWFFAECNDFHRTVYQRSKCLRVSIIRSHWHINCCQGSHNAERINWHICKGRDSCTCKCNFGNAAAAGKCP